MTADVELRQFRAFVAVADHGSFKAAAQVLGVAQSTVSEALAALERTLGASVLVRRRGSREISLTPAGHALLPHARRLLVTVEEARTAVAESDRRARAIVSIIANESISTYVLPGALAALRTSWPHVQFPVTVALCPAVRAGVEAGHFDVGFLLAVDAAAEADIMYNAVDLVVFARPDHPLVGRATSPFDLKHFTMFVSDAAGDFYGFMRSYLESDGTAGVRMESTGSVEAVKRGVLSHSGAVGVLPRYALMEELDAVRVAPLVLHPAPRRMRLAVILPEQGSTHPAGRELVDAVQARLAPVQS